MPSGRHGRVNTPVKGPSCKDEAVLTPSTSRNGSGANYSASLSVIETFVKGGDHQLAHRIWVSFPPAASYDSVASLPLKFLWTQQYKLIKHNVANATSSLNGVFEGGNVILVWLRGLIYWKIAYYLLQFSTFLKTLSSALCNLSSHFNHSLIPVHAFLSFGASNILNSWMPLAISTMPRMIEMITWKATYTRAGIQA